MSHNVGFQDFFLKWSADKYEDANANGDKKNKAQPPSPPGPLPPEHQQPAAEAAPAQDDLQDDGEIPAKVLVVRREGEEKLEQKKSKGGKRHDQETSKLMKKLAWLYQKQGYTDKARSVREQLDEKRRVVQRNAQTHIAT